MTLALALGLGGWIFIMAGGERVLPFLANLPGVSEMPSLSELTGSDEAVPTLVLEDEQEYSVRGVARGRVPAETFAHARCEGFLPETSVARIVTIQPGLVHFNVEGQGDLTLVVRTAEDRWLCDDDGGGDLLPRIVENLPVGVHDVWVGRFSQDAAIDFRLVVSEDQPDLPHPVAIEDPKHERRSAHRRRRRSRASMRASAMGMQAEPASDQPAGPVFQTVDPGMLSVTTTPWSNVRLNGREMGRTPRRNMVAPEGDVRLEVQREGQGPWLQLPARITAGDTLEVSHRFDGP